MVYSLYLAVDFPLGGATGFHVHVCGCGEAGCARHMRAMSNGGNPIPVVVCEACADVSVYAVLHLYALGVCWLRSTSLG